MNPLIEVKYAEAISKIRQVLALYAKRAKDKQGNMLFQDFTLSGAEEKACKTYIQIAVTSVVSDVLQFIQGLTTDSSGISFRARNTRWQSDTDDDFQQALLIHLYNFAAMYSVMKIFQTVAPGLMKEIADECAGVKRDIHDLFFFKYPPSWTAPSTSDDDSSKGPEDVTGIVAPT